MLDVICMGSATIDLFVTINHKFKACTSGEKILMHDMDYETGGGGSNTAVSFARLGVKSAYLGKVGNDDFAERILKEFKKEKVKVIPVGRAKEKTAFSVVMESTQEKDRIIYVHKGATNQLSLNDFKQHHVKAKWLYLSSTLGETLKTTKHLVKERKKGTKVLFNPSSYLCRKKSSITSLLKETDVLVLNKEEAQILTKSKKNMRGLAKAIFALGPEQVIITNGEKALHYFDDLHTITITPLKVASKSVAGAGDAFTSGFLAGMIKGESVEDALKLGVANSCSVIAHRGAKNGLLHWMTAKKHAKKVKVTHGSI